MIADIMINKKFQAIIKQVFIRCRKLNISFVFITQSYFSVPKDVSNNTLLDYENQQKKTRIKIFQLPMIDIDIDSADIDYKDFVEIYRDCTKEPYSFMTIDIRYQQVIL